MKVSKLWTLAEAAEFLREHKETVRHKVKTGVIRGVATGNGKIRQKLLIPEESLQDYIANRMEASQPQPKQKPAKTSSPKRQWV